jgi:hypothetical protein
MRESITTQALAEYRASRGTDADGRAAETTLGGTTVTLGEASTIENFDQSVLGASNLRGIPRGREALDARAVAETSAFQMLLNAITDQMLGGELAFPSDDEDEDQTEAELKALVRDALNGPHHGGVAFDDLVTSAVTDMAVVGNAYYEVLPPEGASLPVAALKDVDAVTIRHHVDDSGAFQDPPFFQAPIRDTAGSLLSASQTTLTPLEREQLLVMRWPGSHRSHRLYPLPPALQLREWLEVIADSTTHLGRYYSDSELPTGILSSREATQNDVETIRDELEAAKGDPRAAPVISEDARWIEIGGSAVDLSHIEEQQWFLQLCMAAFGVPKTELGMDDQVNYSTSESELQVVAKRVSSKLAPAIAGAIETQLLPQFDLYQQLDQPFGVELRYTDPREERAAEQHAREQYTDGLLTYREYRERVGDDMGDAETTVVINGEEIDYGDYPKPVVEALLINARNDDPPGTGTSLGDE